MSGTLVTALMLLLAQTATTTTTSSTSTTAATPPPPLRADPVIASIPDTTAPTIELIIYSAGPELYSFWGHAAIRVIEPSGPDLVYNFGSVDFSGNFLFRLLRGEVEAFVGVSTARRSFEAYRREDRTIVRRRMALDPAARRALARRLEAYVEGDHGKYRYHHFVDNCSTRVADEIDQAFDRALSAAVRRVPDRTFRERALDMVRPSTVLYVFLDIVMTSVIDRPIDRWEASFLPHVLAVAVDEASVDGHPAVAEKIVVYQAKTPKKDAGWPWLKVYLLFMIPLAALTYWRPRVGALIAGLVFGLLGIAIALLWFFTTYDFVKGNVNLALFPPTHLALFFVAAKTDRFRRHGHLVRLYVWSHLLVISGLAIADAMQLVLQAIGPSLGLALPITAVLAVEVRKLGSESARR